MNHEPPTINYKPPTGDADLTVGGCVCPQCFRPLKAPSLTEYPRDRYAPPMRSYAGMCFQCRQACRVVQFKRDGKWLIHSYLRHRYESGAYIGVGDWIVVNPLPAPPAVLTGPGGDYDKALDLSDDPAMQLFRSGFDILSKAAKAFGELIEGLEKIKNPESEK